LSNKRFPTIRDLCVLSLATAATLSLLVTSCFGGGNDEDTPVASGHPGGCLDREPEEDQNLLANSSFEQGEEPWISLAEDSGFEVSEEQVHTGERSAWLRMRDSAGAADHKVYYLVQEITPEEMPEVICGYYRVESWMKGSRHQYLQAVAIAFKPTNFADIYANYQIRYLLAGADSPPFNIDNGKFVFVTREEPVTGEWVPFELHVKDDFKELWGSVPEGFESLRLLFEVRWDNKVAGESPAEADAFYDDLYAGAE
jgi:hypothetical protein